MHNKTFVVAFVLLGFNALNAQVKYESAQFGPYRVGISHQHAVTAEIITVIIPDSQCYSQRSEVRLIIRDEKNNVVLRQNASDSCSVENTFACEQVEFPPNGYLLLVTSEGEPSAPSSGLEGQFFCYNERDRFVPVTGRIVPNVVSIDNPFSIVTKLMGNAKTPLVEMQNWTGNFSILVDYPFRLDGTSDEYAQIIESSTYPVKIDLDQARALRVNAQCKTISLYHRPARNGNVPQQLSVARDSKIEFLDAKAGNVGTDTGWWLHIRIDGHEGFVTGEADLSCLGLPASG